MSIVQKVQRLARRQSNRLRWQMKAASLPKSPDGKVMLHVGCGLVDAPGYINVDARPMPHVHFILGDLRDMSFVPPQSADLVYMCHVLEHVPHTEVAGVLRVMHGITRPGGTLRISVPDFDCLVNMYRQTQNNLLAILGQLMGGQEYAQNFHYAAFNAVYLTKLMERCGYTNVRAWQADRVEHHAFTDWSNRHFEFEGQSYPVSLNLEGTRA